MSGILVERAQAIKDLLVLLVVVALGARFIDCDDFDQTWVLLADHGNCHDGNCGRRNGDHCGIGRRSGVLGDECSHPH